MPAAHRLSLVACLVGLLAYLALAVGVYLGGSGAQPFGVLVLVVPVALGFTFGARPALLGASLPLLVLLPAEFIRARTDDDASVSFTTEAVYVVFVAGLLGFVAWFCGSIRDRYVVGR